MKKYTLVLLFAIMAVLYSCISREQADYEPVQPAINATNNGQSWTALLTDTQAVDSMTLNAQKKLNLLRIRLPILESTSVNLTGNQAQYFITNASNKATRYFILDKNFTNTVSIDINSATKAISGDFKLRFVLDTLALNTDTTGTDTITFTNGTFIVPIKQQ